MRAKRRVRALTIPMFLLLSTACGGDDPLGLFPLWVTTDVRIADVDGDGPADIITIAQLSSSMSQREGRLVVRRQTAAGPSTPQTHVVGVYPWKLEVADIDGDGAPDLVVTDAGAFIPAQSVVMPKYANRVPAGDLDADGRNDLVVLGGENEVFSIFQSRSTPGTFAGP